MTPYKSTHKERFKWGGKVFTGFTLSLILLLVFAVRTEAQSDGPNQAGLVVMHGDGSITTRCVSFAEPEITGLTLLQRSGLQWQSSNGPMGAALCSMDGEGCTASDCFCKCKQAPCAYWNYFTGNGDGSWTYSGVGVAVRTLKNGDIDGWVWGDGSTGPSFLTFDTICSAGSSGGSTAPGQPSAASPTLEATATPTITPSATAAPVKSPTPSLTDASTTPSPTATPTQKPAPAVHQEETSTSTPEPSPVTAATATITMVSDLTPTPPTVPSPAAESEGESYVDTPLAQFGAFALLLCVLVIIYFLQRRRK